MVDIFDEWSSSATSLTWRSTTEANDGAEVTVFTRRAGTPGAPGLVCVHGFPTSSIDYYALARELSADFDIFVLDFPGLRAVGQATGAPHLLALRRRASARTRDHRGVEPDRLPDGHPRSR